MLEITIRLPLFVVLFAAAKDLTIVSVADFHLNSMYDPDVPSSYFCDKYKGIAETKINAPLGRFGCDPPEELIRIILKEIALLEPDLVLVPGDFLGHWMSPDPFSVPDKTYAIILRTLSKVQQLITEYLPNSIMLPSFGNNDTKYHY